MSKILEVFRYILYSIVLFSLITSIISLNIWLDMRVHSRFVVYGSLVLIFLLMVLKNLRDIKFTIICDIIFLALVFLGKFNRISYELRDAFKLPMNIDIFKIVLIVILTIANLLIFYEYIKTRE